jgi:hypothetical protein
MKRNNIEQIKKQINQQNELKNEIRSKLIQETESN